MGQDPRTLQLFLSPLATPGSDRQKKSIRKTVFAGEWAAPCLLDNRQLDNHYHYHYLLGTPRLFLLQLLLPGTPRLFLLQLDLLGTL